MDAQSPKEIQSVLECLSENIIKFDAAALSQQARRTSMRRL